MKRTSEEICKEMTEVLQDIPELHNIPRVIYDYNTMETVAALVINEVAYVSVSLINIFVNINKVLRSGIIKEKDDIIWLRNGGRQYCFVRILSLASDTPQLWLEQNGATRLPEFLNYVYGHMDHNGFTFPKSPVSRSVWNHKRFMELKHELCRVENLERDEAEHERQLEEKERMMLRSNTSLQELVAKIEAMGWEVALRLKKDNNSKTA